VKKVVAILISGLKADASAVTPVTTYVMMVCALLLSFAAKAQQKQETKDGIIISNSHFQVVVNTVSGKVDYLFTSGARFINTTAYVEDIKAGMLTTSDFARHTFIIDEIEDPLGKGVCIMKVMTDRCGLFNTSLFTNNNLLYW